jgi:hypothetical protein
MLSARANHGCHADSRTQVSGETTDARAVGILPAARQKPGAENQDPEKGTRHHGDQRRFPRWRHAHQPRQPAERLQPAGSHDAAPLDRQAREQRNRRSVGVLRGPERHEPRCRPRRPQGRYGRSHPDREGGSAGHRRHHEPHPAGQGSFGVGPLGTQFDALRGQIDSLAGDSGYKGTNFLDSGTLQVDFNEGGTSSLTVSGFDASTGTGGLNVAAAGNAWAGDGDIDTSVSELDSALSTLRTQAQTLSSNNGVVTARQDFTTNMINTLTTGADQLTAADTNEEGANMLALQTRQQLGIVALQLSSQAQSSVMRLF